MQPTLTTLALVMLSVAVQAQSTCNGTLCYHGQCAWLPRTQMSVCYCDTGYTGDTCSDDVRACSGSPCGNNGVCAPFGSNNFTCRCLTGYSGSTCQTYSADSSDNPCEPNPCRNNGNCLSNDHYKRKGLKFYCACAPGFVGDVCETSTADYCGLFSPCQGGGSCVNVPGSRQFQYVCMCPPGRFGFNCENDPCATQPCFNGAACKPTAFNKYECRCPAGVFGTLCQASPCQPNPCGTGTCYARGVGAYDCVCNCSVQQNATCA